MYKIKLDKFEGPLDLLLFFVRKDELNIYDIPIAHITKSYLEYLKLMHELNLDIASEFILMAATLMRIKVRCMLPPEPGEEPEEEPLDPREELTRRLIEYRQFKEASRSLSELDDQWRMIYRRNYFDPDRLPPTEEPMGLKNISFFDLLTAYKKAVSKTNEIAVYHDIERLNVTVEQQIKYIGDFFDQRRGALFSELCEGMSKIEIVVTFLALLDMIRNEIVFVRQSTVFDDIWIQKERPEEDDLPEPVDQPSDESTAEKIVAAENIMTDILPEESAPDETRLEEYDLDQKETHDVISDFDAESETVTPVKETDLETQAAESAEPAEELADIRCLTDQLKTPLEITDDTKTAYDDPTFGDEPVAESLSSSEQWIEDVPASLDHEQMKSNEAPEDEPDTGSSSETLAETATAVFTPEIPDEEQERNNPDTRTETDHEEIPLADGDTEITVDRVDSVNNGAETETSALYEQENVSFIRGDDAAVNPATDILTDAADAGTEDPSDKTGQENAEPELLRDNENNGLETITQESGEEKDQGHSDEYPQHRENTAFMVKVTENSAPVELPDNNEEPVVTAVNNSTVAAESSDNDDSGDFQAGAVTSETIPAKVVSRGEPSKEEETDPQAQEVPVSRVDSKTTDLSEAGEISLSEEPEKPVAQDKSATETKTSVIRKIFTKVLSFVKKIFKR